jgi:hypothetical protein
MMSPDSTRTSWHEKGTLSRDLVEEPREPVGMVLPLLRTIAVTI